MPSEAGTPGNWRRLTWRSAFRVASQDKSLWDPIRVELREKHRLAQRAAVRGWCEV